MIESYEPKATTRRCEKCGDIMVRAACPLSAIDDRDWCLHHHCQTEGWPVEGKCWETWCPSCEPHKAPGYADRATPDGIFMTQAEQSRAPRIAELEAEVATLKADLAHYRQLSERNHWSAAGLGLPPGCVIARIEDLRTKEMG